MSANTRIIPPMIGKAASRKAKEIASRSTTEILELLERCIEIGFDAAVDPEKSTQDKEFTVMTELRLVAQALAEGRNP